MRRSAALRRRPHCAAAAPAEAQRYAAVRDGDVVRLTDRTSDTVVSIMPAVGNIAFGMQVKGHDVLRFPHTSLADFRARPNATGIPFMGPWANRLDEQAFYANGRRYAFDMSLGNVRGAIPIHGFLTTTDQWQVTELRSTGDGRIGDEPARVLPSARVDEAVAVRAHHRDDLPAGGWIPRGRHGDHQHECGTDAGGDRISSLLPTHGHAARRVDDFSRRPDAMGAGREQGANRRNDADRTTLSQSEPRRPFATTTWTTCSATSCVMPMAAPRCRSGDESSASTSSSAQAYRSVVVWAPSPSGAGRGGQGPSPPAERNFICFEPMAGITNALNMAQRGTYKELQTIAPGGKWRERFWIKPSGFERAAGQGLQ